MKDYLRFCSALIVGFLSLCGASAQTQFSHTDLRSASGQRVDSRFRRAEAALGGQRPVVNAGNPLAATVGKPAKLLGLAAQPTLTRGSLSVSWSVVTGPGAVTFTDSASARTEATFDAPGTYVLQLSADDGALAGSDTVRVDVQEAVLKPSAVSQTPTATLTMSSQAGDYIGQGQNYSYSNLTGTLTVTQSYDAGVDVEYSDASNNWSLSFGGPVFGPLQAGTYTGATRYAFRTVTQPGLDVNGDGRGSNTLTGSFVIKKIIYGANGTIASFWATFVQHSEGAAPALSGEVQYNINSTAAPVNQAPAAYAGAAQRVVYPTAVQLAGLDQDDGQPSGTLTSTWSMSSGPGSVNFSDPTQLASTATFSTPGQYVLQLSVSDGQLTTASTVDITVVDPAIQTSLTMTSAPGDYIGQGQSYNFTLETGSFTVTYEAGVATISYSDSTGEWWYLDFATPAGEPFTVGAYSGATRYPFQALSTPGLSVSGDGRGSNTLTGSFTVNKVIYGPANTLAAFSATFVQYGDGSTAALQGEININAGDTGASVNQAPGVYAGPAARVLLPSTLTLSGIAGDDGLPNGTLTTNWSVASGPGNVTFGDATKLQTTAAFAAAGNYVLQLTASDGVLSTSSTINVEVVAPNPNTSLTMSSQAGDYIGQGETYYYTLTDGDFTVTLNYDNGVTVNFATPGDTDNWELDFAAPGGAPLAVGSYLNAARFPFQTSSEPGLNVDGEGRGSNTLTGSFDVYDITYGPNSTILTFDATFIQHSEGAVPALTGEIQFNSAVTSTSSEPPTVYAGTNADVTMPNLLALSGTASDPGSTGALTTTWSMVSGPGTVSFGDASALQTTAAFSAGGTYLLQLLATNEAGFSADSQITVIVVNPDAPTSLTMTSAAGDYIGQGQTYDYTPFNGTFTATENYANGVQVDFVSTDGTDTWTLEFAAPGDVPLTVGSYLGAARFPFQASTQPGLDVYGEGRGSNTLTGSFNVYQITYGPNSTILAFDATFVLHSEGEAPALTGEIKINSTAGVTQPPTVYAGSNANVTMPNALALSGTASDAGSSGALTNTWSMVSGPAAVTFGDASALQTTATFSAGGTYVLQLLATDGAFSASSQITVIVVNPAAPTSLTMTSAPGDYIGQGERYDYTPFNGAFTATANGDNSVTIDFTSSDGTQYWTLDFAAPGGVPLTPGSYLDAARYPFQASNQPGLDVYGEGRGSNTVVGSFNIYQISYGPNSTILAFDASFVLHSDGEGPALTGEIKINSTAAITPPPTVDAGSNAEVIMPYALALSGMASAPGSSGALTTTWSVISGPGMVTFGNPAALATTATFSAGGTYILDLLATAGGFSSDSQISVTVVNPNAPVSLTMTSDPGDYIGQGKTYNYTAFDGSFTATENYDSGVTINFVSTNGTDSWTLDFAAPGNVPLTVGSYANAARFPFQGSAQPGLDVNGEGRGSNTGIGAFNVYEITYGSDSTVLAFHATFVLHSDGAAPALHGEIKFNATTSSPPAYYAGLYVGMVSGVDPAHSGAIRITETSTGAFSGSLSYDGAIYALKGNFGPSGQSTTEVLRKGLPSLTVTLLAGSVGQDAITGSVSDGTATESIAATHAIYSANDPAPQAGRYSVMIPADATQTDGSKTPQGYSVGVLNVMPIGLMTLAGTLADGTKFSVGSTLTHSGVWYLFLPLYSRTGMISGSIQFESTPDISDLDGSVTWTKSAAPKASFYPGGFKLDTHLYGALYTPTSSVGLPTGAKNTFTAHDGNLSADLVENAAAGTGKTSLKVTGGDSLSLTVTRANGLVTGTFKEPGIGLSVSVNAIVYQKGAPPIVGNFTSAPKVGAHEGGAVSLTPP